MDLSGGLDSGKGPVICLIDLWTVRRHRTGSGRIKLLYSIGGIHQSWAWSWYFAWGVVDLLLPTTYALKLRS
jgi:hypothetical protein